MKSVEQRVWLVPKPTNWKPRVAQENDRIIVTFFTWSGLGEETLSRYLDDCAAGSNKFKSNRVEMAIGAGDAAMTIPTGGRYEIEFRPVGLYSSSSSATIADAKGRGALTDSAGKHAIRVRC
jgi:hypothetical protein